MTKVLVTGGAGFIGYFLSKYLTEKGYFVTIADNLFRGKMDDELKVLISKQNIKCVQIDLTKKEELDKLDKDYDYVYHLAAINGTKHFYEIPDEVLRVNVLSVINILEWFKGTKCKKILFSSSSETYAGTNRTFGVPIPTPENVPLCIEDIKNPRWSYGGSKIIGELFFVNYARRYNLRMSIIRYHNIYGPRMGFEHVIPEFSMRIKKKETPFTVKGGSETRAFCYVSDAVEATNLVMESDKTDGEIIHIGNDQEEITILDLAKKLLDLTENKINLKVEPAPEGCVQRRCPNISKLKSLTGYTPKVPLIHGLKETFGWYSDYYERNKK